MMKRSCRFGEDSLWIFHLVCFWLVLEPKLWWSENRLLPMFDWCFC